MKNPSSNHFIKPEDLAASCIYLSHRDFSKELEYELGKEIVWRSHDLIMAKTQPAEIVFAQDIWHEPQILEIESIGDAVKKLKAIHSHWYPHVTECARRTMLIAEQLRVHKKPKPWAFPISKELPNFAVFTLLDQNTLLYSTKREKPVPDGLFEFVEDKVNPPNRAYLKLWEALSILKRYPTRGEIAFDLGASPGGWTFVLQSFGAKVRAVDKAPLAAHIANLPGVSTELASAFSISPKDVEHIDWFVCDVACYPDRLYRWLMPWIESGKVKQFIVTIKLQGETDFSQLEAFKAIPGGKVVHLYQNKHEVTFFYPWVKSLP